MKFHEPKIDDIVLYEAFPFWGIYDPPLPDEIENRSQFGQYWKWCGYRVHKSEKEPLNCLAKRKVWRLDQSWYWQYLVKE